MKEKLNCILIIIVLKLWDYSFHGSKNLYLVIIRQLDLSWNYALKAYGATLIPSNVAIASNCDRNTGSTPRNKIKIIRYLLFKNYDIFFIPLHDKNRVLVVRSIRNTQNLLNMDQLAPIKAIEILFFFSSRIFSYIIFIL